jgi:hypothetical protein
MKRLSISLSALALTLALALSGAALTPRPNAIGNKTPVPHATTAATASRDILYYWFSYPEDYYNDYTDIDDEEFEWYLELGGVPVDTNPAGGTLIARGYMNNSDPHNYFPSAYLYAHYVY